MSAQSIFPQTAVRVAEWKLRPEVLGVVHVGSKSHGHGDALSDDDLEVVLTDEAFARLAPHDISELLIEGEGAARQLIYDAEYISLSFLASKSKSHHDLEHYPYESAPILFDRDGRVTNAVQAAAKMDAAFRRARLHHATIDAWIAPRRALKTRRRGFEGAVHLLVARGAKALTRLLFALEWRWVPLDHWLEPELRTLTDPTHAAPMLLDALTRNDPQPLIDALASLEDRLASEGVPHSEHWHDLFLELIHPSRATERAIHGIN
jgi:hypothetical protein